MKDAGRSAAETARPAGGSTNRAGRLAVGVALGAGLLIGYRVFAARRGGGAPEEADRASYPPLDTPKPVADAIWIVDSGPMNAMGMTLPVRMTVVRLASGDLLLHSPTRFTRDLGRELKALGPVRHLVAPNIAHWTFLADWQRAFPQATTWAAPGLRDRAQVRRSGIRLDRDLGDRAPDEWAAEIEQGLIQGGLGFTEVYFFHKPTRTLLLTDLLEALEPAKLPPLTRAVMQLSGATRGRTAAYLRPVVKLGGKEPADVARRMVSLEPERVIFAHGAWFEDQAGERLRSGLDWLL